MTPPKKLLIPPTAKVRVDYEEGYEEWKITLDKIEVNKDNNLSITSLFGEELAEHYKKTDARIKMSGIVTSMNFNMRGIRGRLMRIWNRLRYGN